jgi:beta-phosphoglucomutase
MNEIKAGIFDLDGVIVDTARYHYLAWRRLAHELDFDFSSEHNEKLKGVSRMKSLEILLEVGGVKISDQEKQEAAQRKNAWYVDYIATLTPDEILPGAKEFLIEMREQGVKIALGSASKNAGLILQRLQLNSLFDAVIDGNKVTKAKPDPEIFLKAADELNVPPSECVVFEDAQAGVKAAKNGGMFCVGVGDPDILIQADIIIPGFKGLSWKKMQKSISH